LKIMYVHNTYLVPGWDDVGRAVTKKLCASSSCRFSRRVEPISRGLSCTRFVDANTLFPWDVTAVSLHQHEREHQVVERRLRPKKGRFVDTVTKSSRFSDSTVAPSIKATSAPKSRSAKSGSDTSKGKGKGGDDRTGPPSGKGGSKGTKTGGKGDDGKGSKSDDSKGSKSDDSKGKGSKSD
jgi:hypothetical protein